MMTLVGRDWSAYMSVGAFPSGLGNISGTKEIVADQHLTRQRTFIQADNIHPERLSSLLNFGQT